MPSERCRTEIIILGEVLEAYFLSDNFLRKGLLGFVGKEITLPDMVVLIKVKFGHIKWLTNYAQITMETESD